MSGPDRSEQRRSAKHLLLPLVPLYALLLAAKNTAYRGGWLASKPLQAPVISVGNLSVGGAGKTPLVIRLAELLRTRGFAVDVLSRGYGRRSRTTEQVHLAAEIPNEDPTHAQAALWQGAARYGDEPLLIASASRVPVYVGASRYSAGLLAEQRGVSGARVHLLDDGFQHRRLARAVDIVVLHRSDFRGCLLPAGRLREPLSALQRAAVAVLRVEDAAFAPMLKQRFPHLTLWCMTREIVLPFDPLQDAAPAIAFCGTAHPEEFFGALAGAGVHLEASHAFRDHHSYTDADITAISASLRARAAGRLLTTEKDHVRLSSRHRARLSQLVPLQAVHLRARLLDEDQAMHKLLTLAGLVDRSG